MSDQIPVLRLTQGPDPLAGLSAADREKLARIEWLRADNQADPHPAFERLAPATQREPPEPYRATAVRAYGLYSRRLHQWLGEAS